MPSQKHFERLFELLHLSEAVAVKKTPFMPQLDDVDNTGELSAQDASTFRSGVGLLLYLAVDLLECQCTIRALASKVAKPTQMAMAGLRYLAKYLLGVRRHGLMIFKKQKNEGLLGLRLDAGDQGVVLEFFSDSNWASKSMLERAGVGKVRHLSCRILWAQQLTKQGEVTLLKISTTYNLSDLGTKGLSRSEPGC